MAAGSAKQKVARTARREERAEVAGEDGHRVSLGGELAGHRRAEPGADADHGGDAPRGGRPGH
jgi:hypothetical protein